MVTNPGVAKLGIVGEIESILVGAGLAVRVFDDVQPDPTDTNLTAGVAELKAHRADLVVAVGGGPPIDTAKVVLPTTHASLLLRTSLYFITKLGSVGASQYA